MKFLIALIFYTIMNLSVAISQVSIEISDVILDSNTIIINLINLDDKPHIIDISKWMIEKYEVKVNPYLENLGISHTANDKYNLAILSFMGDSTPPPHRLTFILA